MAKRPEDLLQSTARTCDNRTHHLLGFSFLSSANRLCSTGWIQELVVGERCVSKKKRRRRKMKKRSSRKPGNEIPLFFDGRSLSLSPSISQHLLKSAGQRNLVVIVSPTRLLVDPRYTTSAVVKGRWCAEAVPPRTKKDSQTASPKEKPTSGEHEWLLSVQAQFRFLVSRFTVSVPASQSQFFIFVISRLIDRQSSIHPYLSFRP